MKGLLVPFAEPQSGTYKFPEKGGYANPEWSSIFMKIPPVNAFVISVLSSLTATVIVYMIAVFAGEKISDAQKWLLVSVLVFFGVFFVSSLLKKWMESQIAQRIEPKIKEGVRRQLESEIRQIEQERLEEQTGIIKLFSRFSECEPEVLEQLHASASSRVFIQIGRTVFSGSTFWDKLSRTEPIPGSHIQILHAGPESKYLNERVAQTRNSNYAEWQVELEHGSQKLKVLNSQSTRVEGRQHGEPYFWRLFLFDRCAYAQPYLFDSDNSERAPVYKIARYKRGNGTGGGDLHVLSLYSAFSSYFDAKWEESQPTVTSLDKIIPKGEATAVVAIVRRDQFFVFVIPKRYLLLPHKELRFHGIGGKQKEGEEYIEALQREAVEETGSTLDIVSSPKSRYFTTGAELQALILSDTPRPYSIYHRTRKKDPNFAEEEDLWLIGYEAKITKKEFLRPNGEVGVLLYLAGETLGRTVGGRVTYKDIQEAEDGSRIIIAPDVNLDLDRYAVPSGMALIAAVSYESRWTRKLR